MAADFSSRLLSLYILHILSVPGFLLHLQQICPEVKTDVVKNSDSGLKLEPKVSHLG